MENLQSEEQLQELLEKDKLILMFSADWCPDCHFIDPFMPEVEEKYRDYTFIHVDRDQFIDVCSQYDVFGIPSFLGFHKGKEVGRFVSKDRKTREEIESFIESL
ncbi:thioredoxin family protein [Radiobacillus kanasensis]|uniref:thioredoxin family protein n=1 Tax=Radiobacillus kanasensis TaxID=2844358 RepID=UPI001E403157|nr:thioredoxin family protein [Radiobacillus kanasensis]UFT98137.1 thioredoxin family protein [Radiobacillus kanasensis]